MSVQVVNYESPRKTVIEIPYHKEKLDNDDINPGIRAI